MLLAEAVGIGKRRKKSVEARGEALLFKTDMLQQNSHTIIAVDPGSVKCGLAVLTSPPIEILEKSVIASSSLLEQIAQILSARQNIDALIIGDGTRSAQLSNAILKRFPGLKIEKVDEKCTTLAARQRYCDEVPAKGWRRLLPKGLRTPEKPIDDYVAVILGERWLQSSQNELSSR